MPSYAEDDDSWKVIVVSTVCLSVSIIFVALRLYVRKVIIKELGTDDQVLCATLVVFIAVTVLTASCVRYGLGRHFDGLTLGEKSEVLRLIWIASIGYGGLVILVKMTFIFQYRRAFPLPQFQRVCDICFAFLIAWAIGGTIGASINCQPIEKNWDPLVSRDCRERMTFWLAMGILNVVTDVFIFLMPLPLLKRLPLPTAQKAVLIGVFSLGFLTCAISIYRLVTLRASTLSPDPTWTMPDTVIWSVAEVTCALACACIPTLRPLVRRVSGWRRHSYESDESIVFRELPA